jgi:hypothetical protein
MIEFAHLCCTFLEAHHRVEGYNQLKSDIYKFAHDHVLRVADYDPTVTEDWDERAQLADIKEYVAEFLIQEGRGEDRSQGFTLLDEAHEIRRQLRMGTNAR